MVARVSSPGFVGRRGELATLEAAVARAGEGMGSAVLVAGEAGMGKSRLIAELGARARAGGALVLVGESVPVGEGEIPYAPVVGALRCLLREREGSGLDGLLGPARGELARLLPELAINGAGEPDSVPWEGSQGRLFALLLAVLARASQAAPVVLVIEDLHWADRSTRDFLTFLVRGTRSERLALIASYRSDALGREHPLRRFVFELERSGQAIRIELEPFSRAELSEQVKGILGAAPERALVERLLERSEGNPFFTEELLAGAGVAGTGLPESLREALMLRVEGQPPDVRRVLNIAAVAGRRVDHWLLAELVGLGDEELTAALRDAVASYVLVHDTASTGYSFRHALVREAIYADLLPGERRALHLALAGTLSERPELAGPNASAASELAYHYYAARQLPEALAASVQAGIAAEDVHGFAEALFHFERALELWDRVSDAADGPRLGRAEVMLRASHAAHLAGAAERSLELVQGALERINEDQDPVAAALGRERLGRYLWIAGRGDDALLEYRRAIELIAADPPSEKRAFVLAAEAQVLMLCNRNLESAARCQEALEIARKLDANAVQAHLLNTMCANLAADGDFEGAQSAAGQARTIARRLGLLEEIVRRYINGSYALDVAGRVEESIALAGEGIGIARELGVDRQFGDYVRGELIGRLLRSSRWREAEELLGELLAHSPTGLAAGLAHTHLAYLRAEQGEAETASHAVQRAAELISRAGGSMWIGQLAEARATIELWAGHPHAAIAAIDDCLEAARDREHLFSTARLYELGARAHADLAEYPPAGDPHRATAAIDTLLERLDALIAEVTGTTPPLVLASRAACAAERSRIADPPDHRLWGETARLWEAIGSRHLVAYARWREAEALVRASRNRRSIVPLIREASAVAEALGANPLLKELAALARRARVDLTQDDLAAETPSAALQQLALTPREIEVLALLADGLTNREIAGRLVISDKTASVHVSHILGKLSVRNRAAAAAAAHRLGVTRQS